MFRRLFSLHALVLVIVFITAPLFAACGPPPPPTISSAVTAKDRNPDTKEAVGIADTFPAGTTKVYAIVKLDNGVSDSRVKAVWYLLEGSENKVAERDFPIESAGNHTIAFNITSDQSLPSGKYKVEIYLNDKLDQTLNFTVQ